MLPHTCLLVLRGAGRRHRLHPAVGPPAGRCRRGRPRQRPMAAAIPPTAATPGSPGMPGHRYAVRLTNTSGERVLVVLSVDGVNAVSGEDARSRAGRLRARALAEHRDQRLAQVAGRCRPVLFHRPARQLRRAHRPARQRRRDRHRRVPRTAAMARRSSGLSGALPAVSRDESEARRPRPLRRPTHRARPRRRPMPRPHRPRKPRSNASAPAMARANGRRSGSTDFVRASRRPAQVTQLRYDAPARLVALGILPRPEWQRWPIAQSPRAFPQGFVADPP